MVGANRWLNNIPITSECSLDSTVEGLPGHPRYRMPKEVLMTLN